MRSDLTSRGRWKTRGPVENEALQQSMESLTRVGQPKSDKVNPCTRIEAVTDADL